MQQPGDDSHNRMERALTVFIGAVGASSAQPLMSTCSAALAVLRQTAESVTIFNPTAADLNSLATHWMSVKHLTLSGEFDGAIMASGVEEGWWLKLQLQHLTLQFAAQPNPTGRLLLDPPYQADDDSKPERIRAAIRYGPFSLERLAEEAVEEAATGSSMDRRIADARALQDYKEGRSDDDIGWRQPEDSEVQWTSSWHKQLPAAVAAQLSEPLRHLPLAAPYLGSLTAVDLSTYTMQRDSMQLLAAAAPSWPLLLTLKLHWRWVYATDALQHLAAAAPHWPLLQQFWTAEKPARCRQKKVSWLVLSEAGRHWPQLQQLVLPFCVPGPGMAQAAAAWPQLRVLVLQGTGTWGDDAIQQLLHALPQLPLLECLQVGWDGVPRGSWLLTPIVTAATTCLQQVIMYLDGSNTRAAATAIQQHWHQLTSLNLALRTATYPHVPADLQLLAEAAACLPHLQALSLKLEDAFMENSNLTGLSAAAPSWPQLTSFKLDSSSYNSRHVANYMQELAAAAVSWRRMSHFELNLRASCDISTAVQAAALYWHELTSMKLNYGQHRNERDARACASMLEVLTGNASSWPLLQQLTLHDRQGIGPEGCQMLAVAAPAWPQLQQLSINFGPEWSRSQHYLGEPVGGPPPWVIAPDDGCALSALSAAAVHWPRLSAVGLRYMHLDIHDDWGLQWLADTAATCWPQLTRLDLTHWGDLSDQIKYLGQLPSLRELWLPGCTLSIESDLAALRKLPCLVALLLSDTSGWLLNGVNPWWEGAGLRMRNFCCEGCERREEEDGDDADDAEDGPGYVS